VSNLDAEGAISIVFNEAKMLVVMENKSRRSGVP